MVRHCRTISQLNGVSRMSYSDYWRSEFLARNPEYERQSKVLRRELTESTFSTVADQFPRSSTENVAPHTVSNLALRLFGIYTANSGSSELLSKQDSMKCHDRSTSLSIIRRACCLRQRLQLTQQELAKQLGISSRTLQDWEQGRRQPRGPGSALLLQWVDQQPAHSC